MTLKTTQKPEIQDKKLNPRHEEFVRQYFLCNRNASEAYRTVYPKSKNPDVDSAKLLVIPGIQARIKEREAQVEEKFSVSLEQIIREYSAIAFGNIARVMEWSENDVSIIPKDKMAEVDQKFIDTISFERRLEPDMSRPKNADGTYPTTAVVKLKVSTLAKEKTKALDALVKLMGYDKQDGGKIDNDLDDALAELEREARDDQ